MILETVRLGLRSLAANKLRAALTMLGITIGVAAVITMLAVGGGAQQRVRERDQRLCGAVEQRVAWQPDHNVVEFPASAARSMTAPWRVRCRDGRCASPHGRSGSAHWTRAGGAG